MTANQLVAYNLRRIRERDGLTQEQAAERLEPFLGRRWSKATFSAAEASAVPLSQRRANILRPREFSADEILAFSAAFGVPVGYFFLPPDKGEEQGELVSAGGQEEFDAGALIRAVAPVGNPVMRERFASLGSEGLDVELDRIGGVVADVVTDAVMKALAPSRGPRPLEALAAAAGQRNKKGADNG